MRWLLALLLLTGCPSGDDDDAADDDDVSDDDDAADDDDSGDDDAGDDDDSGPARIDLTDPDVVIAALLRSIELRHMVESDALGRQAGDDDCPAVTVDGATTTYSGGCSSTTGYAFAGTLAVTETAVDSETTQHDFAAAGWSVTGDGQGFATIALDGTAQTTRVLGADSTANALLINGTMTYEAGPSVLQEVGPTLVGTYSFDRYADAQVQGRHTFAGTFDDAVGTWSVAALMDELPSPCRLWTAESHALFTNGVTTTRVRFGDDEDPCDFCFPWDVDDVPQAELLCASP